jgi:hypothetical protein
MSCFFWLAILGPQTGAQQKFDKEGGGGGRGGVETGGFRRKNNVKVSLCARFFAFEMIETEAPFQCPNVYDKQNKFFAYFFGYHRALVNETLCS